WPRGFDDPWDQAGAQRIMHRYRPSELAAAVTVLHTALSQTQMGGPGLGWDRHVAGPVATRSIPGDHESIFREPDVRALAGVLAEELDKLNENAALTT